MGSNTKLGRRMGHLISTGPCPFCGGGNNTPCFATYTDGYHCFTCGKKKSEKGAAYAFRPSLTINTELSVPEHTQIPCEFSPNVLQWLYGYYVFDDLIKEYGISYVKYAQYGRFDGESLLFPVFNNKELVFYQQRFFPNKSFITRGDKTNILFIKKHKTAHVVLVEDYLSAVRLGEHINTICLFGVHVGFDMSKLLQNIDMNISIWLDPDKAGQEASEEILNKLTKLLGYHSRHRAFAVREPRTIKIITTEKQPKDYCNEELKQILGETYI